ncbi:hypothetical protein EJ08DRAFT_703208 [Tothia fuscella]|uniref:Uncharacterized protein n=1 Tax=Tothia fuscella TaxID=1048955 RepID=A0A9P4TSF5_9PEZI|nr:hypothetical protein EJ08DRAFT_703208 [Tothia fuscella]
MVRNNSDYLRGGAYEVDTLLPGRSMIGQFYASQLVGRAVNLQWRRQKAWVTKVTTVNALDVSGPNQTKYYDPQDQSVYYAYRYVEEGRSKGHLDKLWGLDELSYEPYSILGPDVSKSSARAWKIGAFNFTNAMAMKAIQDFVASNGTSTPSKDGARWTKTFTLPIYDMGAHN